MYRLKLLTLGIIFFTQFSFAQTDGDQLFDESFLHEIRIEGDLSILEMYLIFESERFSESFTYFPTKVTIDGNEIDSVGLRVKGGVTAFDKKKPLKLDFNEFVRGQDYDGVKKVNLHNFTIDTSYQRELISYNVLRTGGLKAPRTAVAQVFYNGQLQGLYGLVEQIDKNFLQNYFANDEGTLIKENGDGPQLKSDTGSVNLFNDLNTFVVFNPLQLVADSIESILDVDAFFRQLVLQNIMNTVDNIFEDPKNFYLYLEPKSQLRYFIPWDYNYSFLPNRNNDIDKFPEGPIASKLLLNPQLRLLYFEIACEMLQYNFTEERIFPILDFRKELIRSAALNDPLVDFTEPKFDAKNEEVKSWLSNRRANLLQQLASINFNCFPTPDVGFQKVSINEIMASSDSLSGISDPAGSYPDWIELYNGSSADVNLSDWYLSNDKDFKKHWKFPKGTVIQSGSYLVVWADRDVDEDGLHADFKLSKDGGEVYLTRENLEVVDLMSFGEQQKNISYARIPNGFGDFEFGNPTFNKTNMDCSIPIITEIDTTIFSGNFFEGILIEQDTSFQKDLIARNGCDSTVQIQITVETSSTNSLVDDFGVELFPNPANGQVVFKTKTLLPESGILVFYNTLGQRVLVQPILKHSSTQKIDIEKLSRGVYFSFLEIESDNFLIQKIVVE